MFKKKRYLTFGMKTYLFLILGIFFLTLVSSVNIGQTNIKGVDTTPSISSLIVINDSTLNVNNSQYLQGYVPNDFCRANGTNSSGVDCIANVAKKNAYNVFINDNEFQGDTYIENAYATLYPTSGFTIGGGAINNYNNQFFAGSIDTKDLGTSTYRWRDLWIGRNINVSHNVSAQNFFGKYLASDGQNLASQDEFGNTILGNQNENTYVDGLVTIIRGQGVTALQTDGASLRFYLNLLGQNGANISANNISATRLYEGGRRVCLDNQTGCNYTGIGGGNLTFNQTLTNTLYAGIQWGYNQTVPRNMTNVVFKNETNELTKTNNFTGTIYTNNTIYIDTPNKQGLVYRTSSGSSNLKAIEIQNASGTIIGGINKAGGVMIGEGAGSGGYYGGYNSPNLDIAWGGVPWTIFAGAEENLQTRTNNTLKVLRMGMPHFYSHEEPVIVMIARTSSSTSTSIGFGYGTSIGNMPTEYYFGAAPTINTLGSNASNIRFYLSGLGHVSFNSNRAVPLVNTEYYYNWTSQLPASYTYQHWEINPSQTAPILNVTKNLKEVLSISQTGAIISNDTISANNGFKINSTSIGQYVSETVVCDVDFFGSIKYTKTITYQGGLRITNSSCA